MQVTTYRLAYLDQHITICDSCVAIIPHPLGPVSRGKHSGRCSYCEHITRWRKGYTIQEIGHDGITRVLCRDNVWRVAANNALVFDRVDYARRYWQANLYKTTGGCSECVPVVRARCVGPRGGEHRL